MARIIIGAGSNLGNRRQNVRRGMKQLAESGVKIVKISPYLKNPAAEGTTGGEFLNAAVLAETDLEPELLLKLLHDIEKNSGRPQPHRPKEARSLDLDIIYYANRIIDRPGLQVPHPRRLQRRFVMKPAAEAAPDFCDPVLKKPLMVIARRFSPQQSQPKKMFIVSNIPDLQKRLSAVRKTGRKIGLVPTMGALHEGHLALIRACRKEKMFCAVSIFVNPAQFGPAEDYRRYPRNLKKDAKLAEKVGAGLIFAPAAKEIYPDGYLTFVEVESLSGKLCGKYRSGHFRGVTTVVLKLFNLIQPDKAYFGWKDAQQLIIIKKMAQDLNLPVTITGVPTVREPDGLAMSSRNAYLSAAERKIAPVLYQTLLRIKNDCEKRGKSLRKTLKEATARLKKDPLLKLQYLEAVDLNTLESVGDVLPPPLPKCRGVVTPPPEGKILVAVAAFLGSTRLIDNIFVKL